MRYLLIAALALFPTKALASITYDALFDLVINGDIPAVEAALKTAVAEDAAATGEPERQRDLFSVFTLTHPGVADFTAKWLEADPQSAYALTARGWHQYGMGWAMRGEGLARDTFPGAFQKMREFHEVAFDLMSAATEADPTLLAASDGVLRIPQTLGNIEAIPGELERIMATLPNRGSLMRAMLALSPQWGGRSEQVELLCGRYAPKITTMAGYDALVCRVDAAYYADFQSGDQREAAHQMLTLIDNPVLDYARLMDAVDNVSTPQQAIRLLERAKSARPLTVQEAEALDHARSMDAGFSVIEEFPERDAAMPQAVVVARRQADRDPLMGSVVTRYISLAYRNASKNGGAVDRAEVEARLKQLLTVAPYDGNAWLQLAQLISEDGSLAGIEAAQPYFENAVVYSNYRYDVVYSMLDTKLAIIRKPDNWMASRDISGLSSDELAELDRIINCPVITDHLRMQYVCMSARREGSSCANGQMDAESPLAERMSNIVERGVCKAEIESYQPEELILSPVEVTF